jgi:hypothetical protein
MADMKARSTKLHVQLKLHNVPYGSHAQPFWREKTAQTLHALPSCQSALENSLQPMHILI